MAKKKNVDEMTLEELREEASARELEGRSGMNKEQLAAALKGEPGKEGMRQAPWPPPTSDQAGEKTANIPPSKLLPAEAPEAEGVDEVTQLKAVNAALASVVRNLGGNPEEVTRGVTQRMAIRKPTRAGPVKTAYVTPAGGQEVEVEYPADAEDAEGAAVEAYQQKAGLWHMPERPAVRLEGKK